MPDVVIEKRPTLPIATVPVQTVPKRARKASAPEEERRKRKSKMVTVGYSIA